MINDEIEGDLIVGFQTRKQITACESYESDESDDSVNNITSLLKSYSVQQDKNERRRRRSLG